MKIFSQKLVLTSLSLMLILLFSCKQDVLEDVSDTVSANQHTDQIPVPVLQTVPSGPGKTILGNKLNNPFAKTNIEQTVQAVYGMNVSLDPTHYYIRMRPATYEHTVLMDSLDLDWEDQPLGYEIVYQGEYYTDDDIPEGEPGWFYATVPADFEFPDITHEVLEEMIITPYYTHFTYRAFELSGHADLFEGESVDGCTPACGNWPECLEENVVCWPGANPILCEPDDPEYPCCLDPTGECCVPGGINWPACMGGDVGGGGTPSGCGCPTFANTRKPAGKITVEDTVLDPNAETEGVRDIKVRIKRKGWFSFIWRSTRTDDDGCFKLDHAFNANRIKVKLKFKNDYCVIKNRKRYLGLFAYMSRDFQYNGPNYANLCIKLFRGGDNTFKTRDWHAATVNNAVAEFHDWELPLPEPLDIWIEGNNNGAPMYGLYQTSVCLEDIIQNNGTPIDMGDLISQVAGQLLDILPTGLYAPDIVLTNREHSDRFRATIYHELAHASHYKLAGECYWQKVRAHEAFWEIQAGDPYGDPTNIPVPEPYYTNFPIVAVTESWGEHVGVLYASRKYPTTVISGLSLTWPFYLEDELTVRNNFIPEGLHWDLIDGINPSDGTLPNGVVINDAVSGATLVELYNLLDNETVVGYRTDVISSTSATGAILPLFSQYGY